MFSFDIAEPNTGISSFMYTAKPCMGIIEASARKSLSVKVRNDSFHHNAKIHTYLFLFTSTLLNSKNS
jgi:hypothetical protein